MTTSAQSALYAKWDTAMEGKNPPYAAIYEEMMQHMRSSSPPEDVEFLWRLSKATFGITLAYDIEAEQSLLIERAEESMKWADMATKMAPGHFAANLMKARVIDRLAFFTRVPMDKFFCVQQLVKHLAVCTEQHPVESEAEPMVEFLQTSIFALLYSCDESGVLTLLEQNTSTSTKITPLNPEEMERKLRRAVQRMPSNVDAYLALVTMLTKLQKHEDARKAAEQGIAIERTNKWEKCIGQMLEMAVASLPTTATAN